MKSARSVAGFFKKKVVKVVNNVVNNVVDKPTSTNKPTPTKRFELSVDFIQLNKTLQQLKKQMAILEKATTHGDIIAKEKLEILIPMMDEINKAIDDFNSAPYALDTEEAHLKDLQEKNNLILKLMAIVIPKIELNFNKLSEARNGNRELANNVLKFAAPATAGAVALAAPVSITLGAPAALGLAYWGKSKVETVADLKDPQTTTMQLLSQIKSKLVGLSTNLGQRLPTKPHPF